MFRISVIIAQIILLGILIWSFIAIRSCSVGDREKVVVGGACSTPNEVREAACPAGQAGRRLEICKDSNWIESFNDCKPSGECSETTFSEIKPIIDANCVSCHSGFNDYETAKAKIDQYIARVNKPDDDPTRMPKAPSQPLVQSDKDIFQKWKDGGLKLSCSPQDVNNNPHIDLDYIERAIDADLEGLSRAQQEDARYLITSHKSNEKGTPSVLKQFKNGVNKSINSLSFVRNIITVNPIDQYETVYRVSLRSLGLRAADWVLIENAEPINLVSVTNRGLLLRQLTKTRKPWLHVDSFAFTSNQAPVYHALRKLPLKIRDLFALLGVEFDADLANFEALHVGFENSPISLNKNRLLARFFSNDGSMWITFDVAQNQGGNSNLFQFPLLKANNAANNFNFAASESIFSLPNGLHGYYLSDNKGNRADAAPLNIVADNVSPFSPEIKNSLSCYRCHSAGFIPAKDEIRNHILENAAQFDLRDVEVVEQLYRNPEPYFKEDNGQYQAALAEMGILAADADPVNLVGDNLRRNQNSKAVAALLLLTEEEFLSCLGRSADGRAQVGNLLTGGSVTFEQLQASLPVILRDCRIGQEPLRP